MGSHLLVINFGAKYKPNDALLARSLHTETGLQAYQLLTSYSCGKKAFCI